MPAGRAISLRLQWTALLGPYWTPIRSAVDHKRFLRLPRIRGTQGQQARVPHQLVSVPLCSGQFRSRFQPTDVQRSGGAEVSAATPREVSRRFSTRFFVAPLPEGQEASHCGVELTDSRWLTASSALASNNDDDFQLPHPTRRTLESLQSLDSVEGMLQWANGQGEAGVQRIRPAVVSVSGKPRVVMPGDQLYPVYGDGIE